MHAQLQDTTIPNPLLKSDDSVLIKGGRVIDPFNGMDCDADVGIRDGKIEKVGPNLDAELYSKVFHAAGLLVTPGLIDIHTHIYKYATPLGIDVDQHCLSRGVTTVCDAGSSGFSTFPGLKHYIIDSPKTLTRVLAFLNISAHGLSSAGCTSFLPGGELDHLNQISAMQTVKCIEENRDHVVGVKIRISESVANHGKNEAEAYRLARVAARRADVPLMVHHSFSTIEMDGLDGSPGGLRQGDIYTHCFHGFPQTLIDSKDNKQVIGDWYHTSRNRGVLFDVGHGQGSFNWRVAEIFASANPPLWPDTVSTDLHAECKMGPCYDLTAVMSKFLYLGMPLPALIDSVTAGAAHAIGWDGKIGCLTPGVEADVTILALESQNPPVLLEDCQSYQRPLETLIVPRAVWRAGKQIPITHPHPFPNPITLKKQRIYRKQLIVGDDIKPSKL